MMLARLPLCECLATGDDGLHQTKSLQSPRHQTLTLIRHAEFFWLCYFKCFALVWNSLQACVF